MKFVPNSVSQKVGRLVLQTQKHSPRIMFVAGIGGVVVSTVLACRATMKLEKTLDGFKFDVDEVAKIADKVDDPNSSYTKAMHVKNVTYVYAKGSYELVKLYSPAIIVGGLSIAALTGSHVTLNRRNASLTAAYTAVQASFDAYRERVQKELGEERELEIRHAVEKIPGPEKGSVITTADPNKWSMYAKFFEESNPNWQKSPELNRLFIQCQQTYLNQLLLARGHVFLNEAYDALGIERSKAGQMVGWLAGAHGGDNYIDFGIFNATNAGFVNGWEPTILLDFNVDGVIFDQI